MSATVIQDAVLRWQERLHFSSKASTAVQQRMSMICIIDAASETVRTHLPEGLLPRATAFSAVHHMLSAFYGNLNQQTEVSDICSKAVVNQESSAVSINARVFRVQEDVADRELQAMASHTRTDFKKERLADAKQQKQTILDTILHQAEPNWQPLLL